MGTVQGNIRLTYENYLRRQTRIVVGLPKQEQRRRKNHHEDHGLEQTMLHHRIVPRLSNIARHDYNSNIIDKLQEGLFLWHIKPSLFRNHKYFKVKY
jgi:hypothetical protein